MNSKHYKSLARKKRKFADEVCYFCGQPDPDTNEDIPGKLFGVNEQTGGLIVPAHNKCNKQWNLDQESFRLRAVIHRGSAPGAEYIQFRELLRLKGDGDNAPQIDRWTREKAKIFPVEDKLLIGLTENDLISESNVLSHWAAGIHYFKKNAPAGLPGTFFMVEPGALAKENFLESNEWKTTNGDSFGNWWFFTESEPSQSITIINLLNSDELWFVVKFPQLERGNLLLIPRKN